MRGVGGLGGGATSQAEAQAYLLDMEEYWGKNYDDGVVYCVRCACTRKLRQAEEKQREQERGDGPANDDLFDRVVDGEVLSMVEGAVEAWESHAEPRIRQTIIGDSRGKLDQAKPDQWRAGVGDEYGRELFEATWRVAMLRDLLDRVKSAQVLGGDINEAFTGSLLDRRYSHWYAPDGIVNEKFSHWYDSSQLALPSFDFSDPMRPGGYKDAAEFEAAFERTLSKLARQSGDHLTALARNNKQDPDLQRTLAKRKELRAQLQSARSEPGSGKRALAESPKSPVHPTKAKQDGSERSKFRGRLKGRYAHFDWKHYERWNTGDADLLFTVTARSGKIVKVQVTGELTWTESYYGGVGARSAGNQKTYKENLQLDFDKVQAMEKGKYRWTFAQNDSFYHFDSHGNCYFAFRIDPQGAGYKVDTNWVPEHWEDYEPKSISIILHPLEEN